MFFELKVAASEIATWWDCGCIVVQATFIPMSPRDPQIPPPKSFAFNWPKKIPILTWVASWTSASAQNEWAHTVSISLKIRIKVANRMNWTRQVRKISLIITKSSQCKRFWLLSSCDWRSSLKMHTITTKYEKYFKILPRQHRIHSWAKQNQALR